MPDWIPVVEKPNRSISSPRKLVNPVYPCEVTPPSEENAPRKPEELTSILPGTTVPRKFPGVIFVDGGGVYRKLTPMVSVQLEVHGWVPVKVAQALTSKTTLSAHVGTEQNAKTTITINNLRIETLSSTPRR
jgi:hypothetical protein